LQAGRTCPNPSWEKEIQDLLFTFATIMVEQPHGQRCSGGFVRKHPAIGERRDPRVTSSAIKASPDLGR
jgi:hypothetical protein